MIQFISQKQKLLLEHLLTPLGVKLVITDKSQYVTCKDQKALLVIRHGQLWLCKGLDQKWSQQDNLSKWINEVRDKNQEIPELRNIPFLSPEELLMSYLKSVPTIPVKLQVIVKGAKDKRKALSVWKSQYAPLLGQIKTGTIISNFKQKVELCQI